MSARDRILATIRASLVNSRATLAAEAAGAQHTPPSFVHPPQEHLLDQFAAELAQLEGYPHRCADDAQALAAIRSILESHAATSVVAWDREQIGLPGLDALLASLSAREHIAVLRGAQVVRGLGEALALLQARHGPDIFTDSSNLTLISGPSRTADIELTLTLGVHGPREIHVVLID
jgi:L-lactate dehydrogenase complex protein LldG